MKVLIFGATGMVGQGVLRECLLASDVDRVRIVGRTDSGQRHPKLDEVVRSDLFDYAGLDDKLSGFDACFFCLGVSSVGVKEADYTRITYDLTLAAAQTLARLNPPMTFIYVTGAYTDSSEHGRTMWARVKGRTENALLRLPFKAFAFRPGVILPVHGAKSKTGPIRWFYAATGPLLSLGRRLAPNVILTTEIVGRAMLAVARHGAQKRVLESADIEALGRE